MVYMRSKNTGGFLQFRDYYINLLWCKFNRIIQGNRKIWEILTPFESFPTAGKNLADVLF